MRNAVSSAVLLALSIAAPALAQSPAQPVTPCDLARDPQSFNGKIVRFTATILIGFEQFEVLTANCGGRKADSIWLEYGRGPKHQPTIWCCGNIDPSDELTLVQDAEFRKFHRLLTARREAQVNATLVGRFDSAPSSICPDGVHNCCTQALGHFKLSCARLVIQSVAGAVFAKHR
jgi:hypothetical protein